MSSSERVNYKRLPGRRRGVISGSSVWQGPDHLLLVRSWRLREQYKRYYLGDIQSIAMAEAPRFHLSTRSIGIAILWLIAFSVASASHLSWPEYVVWAVAAALVLAWVYVSAKCSCVCRIYTAVSGDELPSVYRTWTARKFMRLVEAQITGAQGALESEWADEVEARRIGPPEEGHGMSALGAAGPASSSPAAAAQHQRQSLLLPVLFIVVMLVDAALSYLQTKYPSVALTRVGYGVLAVEIGLSVALLILHYRGKLLAGMQKLVIASILCTGVTWYAQPMIQAIAVAGAAARAPGRIVKQAPASNVAVQTFDIATHLSWVVWGVGILLTQRQRRPRAIISE